MKMRAWLAVASMAILLGCASQRAEEFNAAGNAKFKADDVAGSIQAYGEAVRLKPDVAKYHFNLGMAFFKLHHADEASRHFQEALRLNPGDVEASRMLSLANIAIAYRSRPN